MKIICIGRNYAEHATELGDDPPTEPLLFGKFENTLVGPGEPIVIPRRRRTSTPRRSCASRAGRRDGCSA
jgi:2-keto-4-pentenoate hydratase/2-oxohepta-3-ene-1,7-dioic acid hydratase in catechol pathway